MKETLLDLFLMALVTLLLLLIAALGASHLRPHRPPVAPAAAGRSV